MDADWFDNEGRDSEPCRLASWRALTRPWVLLLLLALALAAVLCGA